MEVPDLPIKSEEYQTDIEMVRAKLEDLERESKFFSICCLLCRLIENSRVQNLIQLRLNMESQLKKQFELSLLSLSPEIRDMPIKTFMETCNGDFEEARRVIVNTKVQSKLAGSTPAKMSGKGAFGENRRPPSSVFQVIIVSLIRLMLNRLLMFQIKGSMQTSNFLKLQRCLFFVPTYQEIMILKTIFRHRLSN